MSIKYKVLTCNISAKQTVYASGIKSPQWLSRKKKVYKGSHLLPRAGVTGVSPTRRRPNSPTSSRAGSCPSPLQNPPEDPTRPLRAPRTLAPALAMAPPLAAAVALPLGPLPPRLASAGTAQAPVKFLSVFSHAPPFPCRTSIGGCCG